MEDREVVWVSDSLSQPAAASSLREGAFWIRLLKPPSLREVAREAGRKESAILTDSFYGSAMPQ